MALSAQQTETLNQDYVSALRAVEAARVSLHHAAQVLKDGGQAASSEDATDDAALRAVAARLSALAGVPDQTLLPAL